ncbi:hypothetical protein IQ265_22060 [Nodosilinea sp. LEGE 06152]|uniref:hypothetical protein n=1 Tax=Nodosilinea sp. LEGE 06152 TaxID=2777966 RepID=UPI001882DF1C|nr:hypothetical protein [Nodosilinea sp. LEGE 06152]MBE9159495.1 hypothetical protein [Nodosilinea sp. LEGE 06152]
MRIIRYGSWLVVGVLLAVVISVTVKLVAASPAVLEGGIAYAQLGVPPAETLTLPGRAFTCVLSDKLDQCTATVEGQPLNISMQYPTSERVSFASGVTCQATYGGNPFECGASYDYGPGALPIAGFSSTLGLSATQMAAIRRTYPFDQVGESGWFGLTQKVAIASAILSCLVAWFNSQRRINEVTGLNAGVATTSLSYGIFLVLLPSFSGWLGWFDGPPLPTVLTIGAGAGAAVLLGKLTAWKTYERANRTIASLASGVGTSLMLLGLSVMLRFWLLTSITPLILMVLALGIGVIGATLVWWQPLLIGRAVASVNLGLLVYCSISYSFLLLMLGVGLAD